MEEPHRHWSRSRRVSIFIWVYAVCLAHVFVSDGKKMSKSLKNYPDPNLVIDQYGADATRYDFLAHPAHVGD